MEFTAERLHSALKFVSPKMRFTIAWASSNVPSIAIGNTLDAPVQVICLSCNGDILPSGYNMKIFTPFFPRSPFMAALPVSPLVAPNTFILREDFKSIYSYKLPRNWRAKSLNARVGPW